MKVGRRLFAKALRFFFDRFVLPNRPKKQADAAWRLMEECLQEVFSVSAEKYGE